MNKKICGLLGFFAASLFLGGCSGKQAIRVNGFRMESSAYQPESELIPPEDGTKDRSEDRSEDHRTDDGIAVYVCGAVREAGVYYLPADARICDAIREAGGFSEDADTEWLNQAQHLNDADRITVYTREETASMKEAGADDPGGRSQSVSSDAESTGERAQEGAAGAVNLNTATREQLMTLPGIGESKADSIIRYREETGPFSCIEDVMNISGIKNSVYSKIRDLITV